MPFEKQTLDVRTSDGWHVALLEYLYFTSRSGRRFRGRIGAKSDGASTPRVIWVKFPPFGPYWLPAVLHDCGYNGELEEWLDGQWKRVMLSKSENDGLILEAMEDQGCPEIDRLEIYEAVKNFGNTAISEDLAKPIDT